MTLQLQDNLTYLMVFLNALLGVTLMEALNNAVAITGLIIILLVNFSRIVNEGSKVYKQIKNYFKRKK